MRRASESPVPTVEIAPGYRVARILNGGWQLADDHGGGPSGRREILDRLERLAEAGFVTFDCADIYGGVEALLGELLARLAPALRRRVRVHTKFVPDRSALSGLGPRDVERAIDRSLRRLGVECLDLVQLHWWDWETPGWVEAAAALEQLRAAGKLRLIGVTNFDRRHLSGVLAAGVPVAACQVQYSLLDRRPEHGLRQLCEERRIALFAYGALAGGFLDGAWAGAPPPAAPANRSLVKYRLIIDEFGGWELYQELLAALGEVASRHGATPAAVALAWLLQRAGVAGAILGVGRRDHRAENRRALSMILAEDDLARLDGVVARSAGPLGDVYELERRPGGPHAAILRTELRGDG